MLNLAFLVDGSESMLKDGKVDLSSCVSFFSVFSTFSSYLDYGWYFLIKFIASLLKKLISFPTMNVVCPPSITISFSSGGGVPFCI